MTEIWCEVPGFRCSAVDFLDVQGLLLTVGLFVIDISGQRVGPVLRDI